MTVSRSSAPATLRQIVEGINADRPNGPEPEFVIRVFNAAIDQRPDNPEQYPAPTAADWEWLGHYAARTGQSWIMDWDWVIKP